MSALDLYLVEIFRPRIAYCLLERLTQRAIEGNIPKCMQLCLQLVRKSVPAYRQEGHPQSCRILAKPGQQCVPQNRTILAAKIAESKKCQQRETQGASCSRAQTGRQRQRRRGAGAAPNQRQRSAKVSSRKPTFLCFRFCFCFCFCF